MERGHSKGKGWTVQGFSLQGPFAASCLAWLSGLPAVSTWIWNLAPVFSE